MRSKSLVAKAWRQRLRAQREAEAKHNAEKHRENPYGI